MAEEEPPRKRRRCVECGSAVYYYAVGATVIPIWGLVPSENLTGFRDALIPDSYGENIEPGESEDHPFWVPPCLWPTLLASSNPMIEMIEANMLLHEVTVNCHNRKIMTLIYDLRASMNTEAGDYWTAFYDRVVDRICKGHHPSNECLPYAEDIVLLARGTRGFITDTERSTLQNLYPELYYSKKGGYFPLWVFRDLPTALGQRKQFLERIAALFHRYETRVPNHDDWPDIDDATFEAWLLIYWTWRNYRYQPEEEGLYGAIVERINCRHAFLFENTRKLFKPVVQVGAVFIFLGAYTHNLPRHDFTVVDPITCRIIDMATAKGVWTDKLTSCLIDSNVSYTLDVVTIQNALQDLPSANAVVFTFSPFCVHPILTCLMNADPQIQDASAEYPFNLDKIAGVPSDALHWENLDKFPSNSVPLEIDSCNEVISDHILDPTLPFMCFHPKLRRVIQRVRTASYFGRILTNDFQAGDEPLGKLFSRRLSGYTTDGTYNITSDNKLYWRLLVTTRAIVLFPEEVREAAKQFSF